MYNIIIKIILLCFLVIFKAGAIKKNKILPSYLQKAYTIKNYSLIYTRPSFDSMKIHSIPSGQLVTISRKIYYPKQEFGSFYRIYITKPKKMKAYISEIDVVANYIPSSSKTNPAFKIAKKQKKNIKQIANNRMDSRRSSGIVNITDPVLSTMKFIGVAMSSIWLSDFNNESTYTLVYGVKLTGSNLPIKNTISDINVSFYVPPENDTHNKVFTANFLLKKPIVEAPVFLGYLGGGVSVLFKTTDGNFIVSTLGANMVGSVGGMIKINKQFYILTEGTISYDLKEQQFTPTVLGSLLVSF